MVCFTGSLYLIGAVRRIVLMEEAAAVAKSKGAK